MKAKYFYLQFLFNYFAFATLSVNMIPFLKQLEYSSTQRGLLFAISAVFGIILQFIIGYICDKYRVLKWVSIIMEIVMVVACFFFYRFNHSFFYYLVILCLANGFYKTIYNLIDSWVLESEMPLIFGKCRAWGAVGFTVGSLVSTFFIRNIGYEKVSFFVLFGVSISSLCVLKLEDPQKGSGLSKLSIRDFKELFSNKLYVWLIIIFLLINLSATADQYTTVDKLLSLEATEIQIGLKWAIQSFSEVPVFLFGERILKKYNAWSILKAGIILYIVKFILYGWVNSINGVLVVTAMQIVTYPLITLSSRIMITDICKESKLKTSTQLIASGIYLGISALFSPLIGGYLVDLIGSTWTLYVLGIFLILPLLLSHRIRKQYN